jgi:glutathione S-transferase/GST-like protein
MLEVYSWQPNANSGKPLFCLHEKGVPLAHHYVDMGKRELFSLQFLAINRDGTIVTMRPERGRWG